MFQSSAFSFTIFIFHYHLTLLKEVRCDECFWEENIYPGCSERICRTFRCVMALATFFMKKNAASDIIINRQPFYEFFSVFYHYGLYAVELFFMISGFIFFYLYADNIHSNKTSAKTFIVNRVSRLYPLYIFTFAVVAILQIIFFKSHNYFFVYPMNDIYHAILNLLMIQSWGFERGWSFNAPTWSVSIEVLMYMIFFILCKFTSKTTFISILIVALSYYFFKINNPIMIGAFSFFIGGLTYKITIAAIKNISAKLFFIFACIFLLISWGVIFTLQVADIFSIILFGFTSIIFFLVSISAIRNDFGKKLNGWAISVIHLIFYIFLCKSLLFI